MNMRVPLLIAWFTCFSATVLANDLEDSKIKCSEMGEKFSSRFKREHASEVSIWGNPEFHYSKTLGTCLVYTEIIDGALDKKSDAVWHYRRVTDIYSNKVIAYSRYLIDKNDPTKKEILVNLSNVGDAVNLRSDKFASVKAELFSQ